MRDRIRFAGAKHSGRGLHENRGRPVIATAALILDTFREAYARRIFWGFFGCSTALLLFLIFIMRVDVVAGALAMVTIFGRNTRSTDVKGLVTGTQSVIAMILYFAGMALAVF